MDAISLGARLRAERRRRGLTLDGLAAASGVSRSMLSEVERGSRVPTVLVLDRIATGLGTSIARLLREEAPTRTVVLRHGEQDVARDPVGLGAAGAQSGAARGRVRVHAHDDRARASTRASSRPTGPAPGSTWRWRPARCG